LTLHRPVNVTLAEAGVQGEQNSLGPWIFGFAGMTSRGAIR
jgi:hypothetical protein